MTKEENGKLTWQDMKYGEKTRKTWKIRHKQCRTWSEARNNEKVGKGKIHTVHLEYGEKH